MKKNINYFNPSEVIKYVRENHITNHWVRHIGRIYEEGDQFYIEIQEQTEDNYLLDWKKISFGEDFKRIIED